MKIVLVGYMGSGKTTIGRLLAKNLEIDFIDLDTYIETQYGATIPEIFKEKGEIFFRRAEHQYLMELLAQDKSWILATGGGTPCYSGNMELIREKTQNSFYLKVSIPELISRLHREKSHRPLISHLADEDLPEFIGKHLFERSPFYARAQHTLLCDSKAEKVIAGEIEQLLV